MAECNETAIIMQTLSLECNMNQSNNAASEEVVSIRIISDNINLNHIASSYPFITVAVASYCMKHGHQFHWHNKILKNIIGIIGAWYHDGIRIAIGSSRFFGNSGNINS